jgi:hypothetical protein
MRRQELLELDEEDGAGASELAVGTVALTFGVGGFGVRVIGLRPPMSSNYSGRALGDGGGDSVTRELPVGAEGAVVTSILGCSVAKVRRHKSVAGQAGFAAGH